MPGNVSSESPPTVGSTRIGNILSPDHRGKREPEVSAARCVGAGIREDTHGGLKLAPQPPEVCR